MAGDVHYSLLIFMGLLLIVAIAAFTVVVLLYLRLRKGFKTASEAVTENLRLREEIHYLKELTQGMASLSSIRCFVADSDTMGIVYQCGNTDGRFSKLHSLEIFAAGMHEENRPHFLDNCRKLLSGEINEYREEYRYKVGKSYRRIAEYAKVLPSMTPGKSLLVLVDMDITDLEERTLHWGDTEQLLSSIFADTPGYIFLKKSNGNFSYTRCNGTFAALFGMTPQDMIGKTDNDLFDNDMALRIRASNLEAIRSDSTISHKWYFTGKSGRQVAMMCVQRVLHDKNGANYLLGIGMDISGMEHVERTIRRRNQTLRMLVNALPCDLMLLDKDLFILTGNNSMVDAFGLPLEVMRQHRGTELDSGFGDLDPIKLTARNGEPHTATNERYQVTAVPLTDDMGEITAYAVWRIPLDASDAQETAQ